MALDMVPSYMEKAFDDDMSDFFRNARNVLSGIDFDTMVGTGLSSALTIPLLARDQKKNFLIIRKDNDGSHDFRKASGRLGEKWIFVDDFISQGDTFRRVHRMIDTIVESTNAQIEQWNSNPDWYRRDPQDYIHTEFVGAYLYNYNTWRPASTMFPDPLL